MKDMGNKQKLETAAAYMRECAADPDHDADPWFRELMAALAEWLERESQRHVSLEGLDSGYEPVNVWEASWLDPEVAMMEPCIRVANIFIDSCLEAVAALPESESEVQS